MISVLSVYDSWSSRLMVLLSFVLAGILGLLPLSEHWDYCRPQWAALVLIYWSFYSKRSIDLWGAWCMGLLMDCLHGALLGQYATLMVVLRYSASLLGTRLKLYTQGGQYVVIFVLLALSQSPLYLLYRYLGHSQSLQWYSASVVSSLLLWPIVYKMLRIFEQKRVAL